jgi:hypothetical protein
MQWVSLGGNWIECALFQAWGGVGSEMLLEQVHF